MKKKIYATWTRKGKTDYTDCTGIAVSEDGKILTGHLSRSIAYLKHDLGAPNEISNPGYKHDIYEKKFGKDNYEVIWVEDFPPEVLEKIKQEKKNETTK